MVRRATTFVLALLLALSGLGSFAFAPAGDAEAAALPAVPEPAGRGDESPAPGAAETAADAQALPGASPAALPPRAATPNPLPTATQRPAAPFIAVPRQPPRRARAID